MLPGVGDILHRHLYFIIFIRIFVFYLSMGARNPAKLYVGVSLVKYENCIARGEGYMMIPGNFCQQDSVLYRPTQLKTFKGLGVFLRVLNKEMKEGYCNFYGSEPNLLLLQNALSYANLLFLFY